MDQYSHDVDLTLLAWSSKQAHILTGAGTLDDLFLPGRDFEVSELPHYHLQQRNTKQTFASWHAANRRSTAIVGCWARPIFAGGWQEDTDKETEAYNLQTPSIFIDLRFPLARPTAVLATRSSVHDCTGNELRALARQHCFAGYSLPSGGSTSADPLTFTRHHIIDWNFHPRFPRPRPNKWFVQTSPDGASFKEFSVVRDALGIPIYFERWARREGDSNGTKYLALRRVNECPQIARENGREPARDAIVVIVGNHFAFAVNRRVFPAFEGYSGPGGAALVDQAVAADNGGSGGPVLQEARDYLDLEGSYGLVASGGRAFQIIRSTHPWREGQPLFGNDSVSVNVRDGASDVVESVSWGADEWAVLECGYSAAELREMLETRVSLRSKF